MAGLDPAIQVFSALRSKCWNAAARHIVDGWVEPGHDVRMRVSARQFPIVQTPLPVECLPND